MHSSVIVLVFAAFFLAPTLQAPQTNGGTSSPQKITSNASESVEQPMSLADHRKNSANGKNGSNNEACIFADGKKICGPIIQAEASGKASEANSSKDKKEKVENGDKVAKMEKAGKMLEKDAMEKSSEAGDGSKLEDNDAVAVEIGDSKKARMPEGDFKPYTGMVWPTLPYYPEYQPIGYRAAERTFGFGKPSLVVMPYAQPQPYILPQFAQGYQPQSYMKSEYPTPSVSSQQTILNLRTSPHASLMRTAAPLLAAQAQVTPTTSQIPVLLKCDIQPVSARTADGGLATVHIPPTYLLDRLHQSPSMQFQMNSMPSASSPMIPYSFPSMRSNYQESSPGELMVDSVGQPHYHLNLMRSEGDFTNEPLQTLPLEPLTAPMVPNQQLFADFQGVPLDQLNYEFINNATKIIRDLHKTVAGMEKKSS